jgi:hypothetical protein
MRRRKGGDDERCVWLPVAVLPVPDRQLLLLFLASIFGLVDWVFATVDATIVARIY